MESWRLSLILIILPGSVHIYTGFNYIPGNSKQTIIADEPDSLSEGLPRSLLPFARKKYKSKYTIDWYTQGIIAFLTGLSAKDSPADSLLGPMQSDISLCCQTLSPCMKPAPALPDIAFSAHQRSNGSAIDLYHAFLNITLGFRVYLDSSDRFIEKIYYVGFFEQRDSLERVTEPVRANVAIDDQVQ